MNPSCQLRPSRFLAATLLAACGAALATPARADIVPCGPSVAPGTICLSGSVFDGQDGPLAQGQVYVVVTNISVPAGTSLTTDGAILKFLNGTSLSAQGPLSAVGTIFTSIHDDLHGGDTNLNGFSTSPDPGDWGSVRLFDGADASVLDGAIVDFATTGVTLFSADATLTSCQIVRCSGDGLDLTSSSFPTVTGCSFTNCDRPVDGVPIAAVPGFLNNTTFFNFTSDALRVLEGTVAEDLTLFPLNALDSSGVFEICASGGVDVLPGATLRIEPGIVFKFGGAGCNQFQSIHVQGALDTEISAFTSIRDDTIGGDTNKDGSATMPAPGDWGGFVFGPQSDASRMVNVRVHWGGYDIVAGPAIVLQAADVLLDTVLLTDCNGAALDLGGDSFPTVRGCAFLNNGGRVVQGVRMAAVPGFSDNLASGNGVSDTLRVDVQGEHLSVPVAIGPDNTFGQTGVLVLDTSPTVDAGASLTLAAGLIVKATNSRALQVQGTLTSLGTPMSPIAFTSIRDDSLGGDTNKDGASTVPAPGDWDGLVFFQGSDASVLSQACVRFAGKLTGNTSAAIELRGGASPRLADLIVEFSEQAALDLNGSARPQVTGCTFLVNDAAVVDVPITGLEGFSGNDASGNAKGDYLEIGNGTVPATELPGGVTLSPASSLGGTGVFVFTSRIDVQDGARLVVDGGCILKMDHNSDVRVAGTLMAGSSGTPAFFTRIEDDSLGGDTNKDGGATSPDPGDWIGLVFTSTSQGSVLDDVVVRYAGRLGLCVSLSGTSVVMTDVVVRDGQGDALDLGGSSFPTVVNCDFSDCDFAVDRVPIGAVPGFVDNTASGNTTGDFMRVTVGTLGADALIGPSNSLNGGPLVIATNVIVPAGVELALEGGTLVKWAGNFGLTVDGTLRTLGSSFVPVVLTSIHDDGVGGDTNKNGNATAPAPGNWSQVLLNDGADASVLSGLIVDYAGAFSASSLRLIQADAKILECVVRNGLADALDLSVNSFPQVRRSRFEDCGLVAVDRARFDALKGFEDNTASGNGLLDAIRVTSPTLPPGPTTVELRNSLNDDGVFVVDAFVQIAASSRLILRQGVILKLTKINPVSVGGAMDLDGTGFHPVVLTSIRDDGVGGDTNKDGTATLPAPGDWGGLQYQNGGPSRAAHATLRFGGSATTAGLFAATHASLELFGVRVEHAPQNGFFLHDLAGGAANLVAFQCGQHGIVLFGGAFDLLFATAFGNGGDGILAGSGHTGELSSSIAFGNTGDQVSGYAPDAVHFSNAGPTYAGAHGNLDADPLFVDAANGDLRLGPASPCLNVGEVAKALLAQRDRDERSRALDHDLSGAMLPDMGAYERSVYELVVSGKPVGGELLSFTVLGPAGTADLELAADSGFQVLSPLGHLLLGTPRRTLATLQVGQGFQLLVPHATFGGSLAVQATARSMADPSRGNTTQVYRLRVGRPLPATPAPTSVP